MIKINDYFEICVITYNRLEFVSACLSSIINYTKSPYKLIVIDNNSTDGTKEYLQTLHTKKMIHTLILNNTNRGIAEAKNQCVDLLEWKSNFFVMTDSDIVFPYIEPSWEQQMVEVMNHHPKVGVLTLNFSSVNVAEDTKWWFEKQKEADRIKKDDLIRLESGFWGSLISKEALECVLDHNKKKYNEDKVFKCRSLYGETDEMFRQAITNSDKWCGVAKNLIGYNLGWDDNRRFSEYHMFKKIERYKAEQARSWEES